EHFTPFIPSSTNGKGSHSPNYANKEEWRERGVCAHCSSQDEPTAVNRNTNNEEVSQVFFEATVVIGFLFVVLPYDYTNPIFILIVFC
ncbi:MAG: hypothetical protein UHT92_03350, partial [Prevotella sp.]|nr:hypothetical protein [Prevotella sp.]